jgi:hypothetical protein
MAKVNQGKSLLSLAGYALAAMTVLCIAGSIGQAFENHNARAGVSSSLAVLALLGSPAVAMLLVGRERKADAGRMAVYQDIVIRQSYRSIDNITACLGGTDPAVVAGDLQRGIQAGLFPGFTLDLANRIVSHSSSPSGGAGGAKTPAHRRFTFTCATCGADNEVLALPGAVACEYCAAPWVPPVAESAAPPSVSPPAHTAAPSAPPPAPEPQKSERQIIQENLSRFSEFRRGCECTCGYSGMMGIEKKISRMGTRILGDAVRGAFGGSGLGWAVTRKARWQSDQIQVRCPSCDKAWVY